MKEKEINLIDDDVPAYKKKSKKKGQPRSKHKHIYETVLLIRHYHTQDFKTGKPKVTQTISPTKVCIICGRVNEVDYDSSYYVEEPISDIPFLYHKKELSEKALNLPKWKCDFFDKFAVKVEEDV